jgi:hypothetical protein
MGNSWARMQRRDRAGRGEIGSSGAVFQRADDGIRTRDPHLGKKRALGRFTVVRLCSLLQVSRGEVSAWSPTDADERGRTRCVWCKSWCKSSTGPAPWSSWQDTSPLSRSSASPTSRAVCASRTGSPGSWLPRRRDLPDLADPGRVNIFERWESQAALETFRSSGLTRNSARRRSRCPFRSTTSPTCGPCSGRRQSELAARSHARPMRSAPRCGHNEKDHHVRKENP